jgi:hypothetical protein
LPRFYHSIFSPKITADSHDFREQFVIPKLAPLPIIELRLQAVKNAPFRVFDRPPVNAKNVADFRRHIPIASANRSRASV